MTSTTAERDRERIDELARRYMDEDEYPMAIETERVILRIRADDVITGDEE